jgi:peptidoglycan hydrolase-like protein with peptidoglycan-binding domain
MSSSVNRSCGSPATPPTTPTTPPPAATPPVTTPPVTALREPDINERADLQKAIGAPAARCGTPEAPVAPTPLNYADILGAADNRMGAAEVGPALSPQEQQALQKSQQAIVDAGVALFAMASGQNLEDIAKQFDTSIEELKELNPGLAERLESTVGKALDQMIAVPIGDSPVAATQGPVIESGPDAYKVASPDLGQIRQGQGVMHRGMGGPQVMELQRMLNAQGANPPLAVDGKFGPKTEAALKAFQSANGIQQTGALGRQTLGAFDTNPKRIPADAPQTPSPSGPASTERVSGQQLTGTAFGNQVAAAAEREARRLNSVGRCALGVNNALISLGVQGRGHAYQKAEQLANNPRFREVNISAAELSRLPPGAVVVWGRSGAKPYGHVSVALGDGREASDHIQRQITGGRYGTDFGRGPDPQGRQFRVFLPA